jgi:uncharacterized protein
MSERIIVTGGTGFIGKALVKRLAARREVVVLTRGAALPGELSELGSVRAASWDASGPGEWESEIDGADAIVHLAGEQAVGVRYTKRRKTRLYDSRVKSAEALVRAISRATRRPRVLVSASGVDYYAAGLSDEPVDESAPPGQEFLAHLCVAWEGAVRFAEALGVRVVSTRFGAVLGPGADALRRMALPFKLFVGGPLGSGRQIFSWVHLEDALMAIERLLEDQTLSGPFNIVAPETGQEVEFARTLGRTLHRPSYLPVPTFALRLLFGEGADSIVFGRRAVPKRLEEHGFRFAFPTAGEALENALGA